MIGHCHDHETGASLDVPEMQVRRRGFRWGIYDESGRLRRRLQPLRVREERHEPNPIVDGHGRVSV